MLILEGLVDLHRTVQLQVFSVTGQDIDLNYHDIEWFALEMNRDHSVSFETASKYCLMKAKEESEKFGLKLNIQKSKIMLSGPNIS